VFPWAMYYWPSGEFRLSATSARKVISILPFLQKAGTVFDEDATRAMGRAFDQACAELHDKGQPAIVYEVIATRIVDAAKRGEREPAHLCRAGLVGLGFRDKDG
jgi:hypothetical protein